MTNLPASATEELLLRKFCRFGTVESVKLNRDPGTGIKQRSGLVQMRSAADARGAIAGLNLSTYDGSIMSVFVAPASLPRQG